MKDISKINSSDLRIEGVKGIFLSLEKAFKKFDIDFYMIGALARDIMLTLRNEKPIRATQDIDFAVMIPRNEVYENLKKYLEDNEGFIPDARELYRMRSGNIIIDLLPFGDIEDKERTVTIQGKEIKILNAFGLKEVYEKSEIVSIDDELPFKVTTLPGICILKLISYTDRPDARIRDIEDFNFIITKYADMDIDYVINNHSDVMENGWNENMSARILGRDMKSIMKNDKDLKEKIISILENNIKENRTGRIPELMVDRTGLTIKDKIEALKSVLQGIND